MYSNAFISPEREWEELYRYFPMEWLLPITDSHWCLVIKD
jgi:hypothetical protein